uniref:cysteine peptidase family C39 domain-containing protein n=1 Tax=Photorhabdus africana TaxID=3097554 RepID=UPI002B413AEA
AAGGYALVYGGQILIAASAEMATAGRVALEGCKTNPALCLNNVGIFVADAVAPEAAVGTGVLAAGTIKVLGSTKEGAKDLAEGLSHTSNPLLKNAKPDTDAVASLIENEKLYAGKGASVQGGAGGDWKVINEVTDPNVVKQVTPTSCGAACGEMLLKDRNIFVDQVKLGTELKHADQLARDLTKQGGNWKGGFVGENNFDALNKTGSWSAMMWDQGSKVGHWVVVKGTDKAGNVLIHDPWKGTSYKMTQQEFKATWNEIAVFNQ